VFHGAKLKVERANRQIDELQAEVAAFAEGGFYEILVRPNEKGKLVVVAPTKPIPNSFSLIIGDAVHNLRAALDHLATAASRVGGGKGRDLFFPFHKERKGLVSDRSKLDPIEAALPGSKRLIIDEIQSCADGKGSDLYALHTLDKIDKHNDLIVTATGALIGRLVIRGGGNELSFNDCLFDSRRPINLLQLPDVEVTVEHDFKATIDIRFDNALPFGNEAVIPTLVKLSQRVTETIQSFVDLCS